MRNTRDIVEELKHIPHKVLEKIFIEKLKNGDTMTLKIVTLWKILQMCSSIRT